VRLAARSERSERSEARRAGWVGKLLIAGGGRGWDRMEGQDLAAKALD